MTKPLAIDLFCGLGGWTEGLLAEGYDVIGFDIERHDYGDGKRYPAQLVLQDILTLHGRQFKDATLIVASPPCQEFSYMAMPWSRGKVIAAEYRSGARDVKKLTALFDACFRIQREASEAAGHKIPLVVENVRGAIPWVGRSRWNFGSFHLWGDVPALMPITDNTLNDGNRSAFHHEGKVKVFENGIKGTNKVPNRGWTAGCAVTLGLENYNGTKGIPHRPNGHWTNPDENGVKQGGDWFSDPDSTSRRDSSKSNARKAASAMIAKIPFPLARHIAWAWKLSP